MVAAIAAISASSPRCCSPASSAANASASVGIVLEPDAGGEALGGVGAGRVGQHRQGGVALAPLVQQARERHARRRRGVGSSSSARRSESSSPSSISASASEGSSPSRNVRTCGGRLGADELADELAVLERLDRGDALDPERGGDLLVGVGVELGEVEVRLALADLLLEHRRELPAGPAPLGPEVDDDRHLVGARDHVLLEGGLGDVADHDSRVELRAVAEFSVESAGVTLAGEEAGEGTPVVLLHGLTATRRYVVMGSRSLERSGHRVVAYDARGHGASSRRRGPRRLRLRRPRRGPARGAGRPRDRPRGARRRLDGRAHRGADRARPPRARGGAGDRHAGVRPRGGPRRRARSAGTRSPRACAAAASTASSRPTATRRCPSSGRRRSTRCCASGSAPTSTPTRWPTRCTRCRARGRSSRGTSWREIDVPTVVVASRDEADPGPPVRDRRALRGGDPRRGAALRGARQLAAGLAGRPALEGDQRAGGASGRSRAMISSADSTTRSRS